MIEGQGGKHTTYGNMSVVTADDPHGNGYAYTPGYVCIGPNRILNDSVWKAHEYGHYIISAFTHVFYLINALDSFFNAPRAPDYYRQPHYCPK